MNTCDTGSYVNRVLLVCLTTLFEVGNEADDFVDRKRGLAGARDVICNRYNFSNFL